MGDWRELHKEKPKKCQFHVIIQIFTWTCEISQRTNFCNNSKTYVNHFCMNMQIFAWTCGMHQRACWHNNGNKFAMTMWNGTSSCKINNSSLKAPMIQILQFWLRDLDSGRRFYMVSKILLCVNLTFGL